MISQYFMPGNNKIVMNGRDETHKNAQRFERSRAPCLPNLKLRFRYFKFCSQKFPQDGADFPALVVPESVHEPREFRFHDLLQRFLFFRPRLARLARSPFASLPSALQFAFAGTRQPLGSLSAAAPP